MYLSFIAQGKPTINKYLICDQLPKSQSNTNQLLFSIIGYVDLAQPATKCQMAWKAKTLDRLVISNIV